MTRDGVPLYRDRVRFQGPQGPGLARPAILAGGRAVTTLLYVAPDAQHQAAAIRPGLSPTSGLSCIAEDCFVLRAVAADSFLLRQMVLPVLDRVTQGRTPTSWRL